MSKKMKQGKTITNGISVSSEPDSIIEISNAIQKILASDQDQETIRLALDVLRTATSINGLSINGANIVMGSHEKD